MKCYLCKKEPCTCRVISGPIHPDDRDVPMSILHFPISNNRFVQICVPLAPKSLSILEDVLQAWKPALVDSDPDYEI